MNGMSEKVYLNSRNSSDCTRGSAYVELLEVARCPTNSIEAVMSASGLASSFLQTPTCFIHAVTSTSELL